MRKQVPLPYFFGVGGGRYEPVWPVYVVDDNPGALCFDVAVDDYGVLPGHNLYVSGEARAEARRAYITVTAKRRLHQRVFREGVLRAYGERCAACRLGHRELLDGAHIVEDADGGPATVPNGLALCKLHHAAFDQSVIGIHPDSLALEVRPEVLQESDGPMLVHGLQALHGRRIEVPRRQIDRPDTRFLATRYTRFRAA
jgi:putative restriction endonuclease